MFNIKIFTKYYDFNNFFNYDLPKLIIQEFKQKNYIKKENNINKKNIFENLFFLENSNILFDNYFDLYNNLLQNIFGIKLVNNRLFISPKIQIDFKINLLFNNEQKSIFVSSKGKKELIVNNVVYSNISFIDLDLIDKTAFLCV